jgi:4-azaleucine resistance transporter AzlC
MDVRTFWRTIDRPLARDIAAIALAVGFVGMSFGAIAVASGMPAWAVVTMSVLVFAGGSQFLVVGMFAFGNPVAAIVGGLLLNARHLPYGLAVADVLVGSWSRRLVGSHLLIDESVAFALAQSEPPRRRGAYWHTGVALFVSWQAGTLLGIGVGNAVGDPARYGLDAAFPAALLALLLPRLREAAAARVALVGAAVAVVTTFFVPAGLPVLLSLAGLFAAGRHRRAGKVAVLQPDVLQPASSQPDVHQPASRQPDVHQSDVRQSDAPQSDIPQSDVRHSDGGGRSGDSRSVAPAVVETGGSS